MFHQGGDPVNRTVKIRWLDSSPVVPYGLSDPSGRRNSYLVNKINLFGAADAEGWRDGKPAYSVDFPELKIRLNPFLTARKRMIPKHELFAPSPIRTPPIHIMDDAERKWMALAPAIVNPRPVR